MNFADLAMLDLSVARLWLEWLECHNFLGPYNDALLLGQLCRWCEHFSLKRIDNELHAEDAHSAAYQRLGSLDSNLLP